MSDCSEEDIFNYKSLKKRKIGEDDPTYELPSSSRNSQNKQKKKKKRKKSNDKLKPLKIENEGKTSVKAESTQGLSTLEFCPMCQMPLKIAIGSPDLHVAKCVGDFEKSSFEGECPMGVKCDITIRQHYQRFSHHLLSELRAGLNAELHQSIPRIKRETGLQVAVSCESPTVSIQSLSPMSLKQQDSPETKEKKKPDTYMRCSDSELSDSPSVLADLPIEEWKDHEVRMDNVNPPPTGAIAISSGMDLSVESSPKRGMARKTYPYSPRQFKPEKVVCLLELPKEDNHQEVAASLLERVSPKLSKTSKSGENLHERSQNLENGHSNSRTVNARMSCPDSSPLDPNSTVSFCQNLAAHQTSTPKSVKPRNVARKSAKGKKYQSIEDVQKSQRLASQKYFSNDHTSLDVNQKKQWQKLNFEEQRDADTKNDAEREMNEANDSGEVSQGDGTNGRNVEKCSPRRTSSPNLFDFDCEEDDDDLNEVDCLDIVNKKDDASDVENDKREPSSQGNSQCNKLTVQSQIDRYFISPKKSSSQESLASSQKTVDTNSQSSSTKGGNTIPKSTWKDIFKFSQGTKFSSTETVSQFQRNSTKTGSQGTSTSSVSSQGYHSQASGRARRGGGSMWSKNQKRECPFYKKMPGTSFAVDAFSYGDVPGIKCYFLTHFHADHYGGLTKKFTNHIYCSNITANLVKTKLYVSPEYIHPLAMEEEHVIENVKVTFLDANHCPGSVLILFKLPNGQTYLHTGDFRAHERMELYPQLHNLRVHKLYLDTTYCDPSYDFPKQESVVQFAIDTALRAVQESPKTLILCGTYTIGKEKVFKAISDALGCKICVEADKKRVLSCYNDDQLMKKIVTDKKVTRLHVVGMAKLNLKRLSLYLEEFHNLYDNIVAFKPTGWTHSSKAKSLADIKPNKWGRIQIYGIPYSEHSSYSEMKRFVQFIRASGPTNIIPTVNVGRPDQRAFMEQHFKDWMSQDSTSSGMNGHFGSQTRPNGQNAGRNGTSSQPTKTMETFFKKK